MHNTLCLSPCNCTRRVLCLFLDRDLFFFPFSKTLILEISNIGTKSSTLALFSLHSIFHRFPGAFASAQLHFQLANWSIRRTKQNITRSRQLKSCNNTSMMKKAGSLCFKKAEEGFVNKRLRRPCVVYLFKIHTFLYQTLKINNVVVGKSFQD